mmetsp:Transcript_32782/g.76574  ORF Transcript_32782/g.76574 Transcript_32782/m.76574 type:complete len:204 (-) Transcript_32782:71-682(-)
MQELSSHRVPHLARLVEGSCNDLVSKGIVECDRVHHVLVPLERQELLPGHRVPHLAGTVVAAGDEPLAVLVESAVCEREDVRSKDFEEVKLLGVLRILFLDELVQELPHVRPLALRQEGLLLQDLVQEHFHVCFDCERQQVDRLLLHLAIALILQDDARREVPKQEALELHVRGGGSRLLSRSDFFRPGGSPFSGLERQWGGR